MTALTFKKAVGMRGRTQTDPHRRAQNAHSAQRLRTATFHGASGGPSSSFVRMLARAEGPEFTDTRGGDAGDGGRAADPTGTSPVGWDSKPTEQVGAVDRARSVQRQSTGLPADAGAPVAHSESKPTTVLARNSGTGEMVAVTTSRTNTQMSSQRTIDVAAMNQATGEGLADPSSRTNTQVSAQRSIVMAARSDARTRGKERKPPPGGAHYDNVCEDLCDNAADPDKLEHDRMLADTLHKLHPDDPCHPMLKSPRLPMNTGFTDRSNRMREGRYLKAAMPNPASQGTSDWFRHGDCWGDECQPSSARAGGAASHVIHDQKLCRSGRDVHPEIQVNDASFSEDIRAAMTTKHGNFAPTAEEERADRRRMGSKMKAPDGVYRKTLEPGQASQMMPHRTMSPRGGDDTRSAGQYNMDYRPQIQIANKRRQPFQGARSVSPNFMRSGVALILSPRRGDPPPPTKITHARRGDGQYKAGLSLEAESQAMYHNQETLRFASPRTTRGRNTPAQDYESHAGKTTNAIAAASAVGRPLGRSSSSQHRAGLLNNSSKMNFFMDQDLQNGLHRQEREMRLTYDKPFADLCATTSTHAETQRSLMSSVKSWCDQTHGPQLDLSWPGAEN